MRSFIDNAPKILLERQIKEMEELEKKLQKKKKKKNSSSSSSDSEIEDSNLDYDDPVSSEESGQEG